MRLGGLSSNNGDKSNKFLYNNKEYEDENNVPPMILGLHPTNFGGETLACGYELFGTITAHVITTLRLHVGHLLILQMN